MRELFLGRLALDLVAPHPEPDPEEQRRAADFMAKVDQVLDQVDGERIEHDSKIPAEYIDRLRAIGAFGIWVVLYGVFVQLLELFLFEGLLPIWF